MVFGWFPWFSRWFNGFSWFLVGFHGFHGSFMVFHEFRLVSMVFHGSFMVFHGFWLDPCSWFLMAFWLVSMVLVGFHGFSR